MHISEVLPHFSSADKSDIASLEMRVDSQKIIVSRDKLEYYVKTASSFNSYMELCMMLDLIKERALLIRENCVIYLSPSLRDLFSNQVNLLVNYEEQQTPSNNIQSSRTQKVSLVYSDYTLDAEAKIRTYRIGTVQITMLLFSQIHDLVSLSYNPKDTLNKIICDSDMRIERISKNICSICNIEEVSVRGKHLNSLAFFDYDNNGRKLMNIGTTRFYIDTKQIPDGDSVTNIITLSPFSKGDTVNEMYQFYLLWSSPNKQVTISAINIAALKVLNLTHGQDYGDKCLAEIQTIIRDVDTNALIYQHPYTATIYWVTHKSPLMVKRIIEDSRQRLQLKYTFLYSLLTSSELFSLNHDVPKLPYDVFTSMLDQVDVRLLWEKVSTKNLSLNVFKNIMHENTPETEEHCNRLQQMACVIAKQLEVKHNITHEQHSLLAMGALLHDVGKILIPPDILNKPGKLTLEEYNVMKKHAGFGANFFKHEKVFQELYAMIRHHHERYDGNGYPDGIPLSKLPITVSIISFVDTVDAILSTRCYKEAKPVSYLLDEIEKCRGTQFHPDVADAFIKAFDERKFDGILNVECGEEKRA